jgi:GTP-binding protein
MVIGERNKTNDLALNITREKKLSNMRSSGSDNTVTVRPPRELSLDQSIEFISEDELVEITPMSVRLRKMDLDQQKREATQKKERLSDQH